MLLISRNVVVAITMENYARIFFAVPALPLPLPYISVQLLHWSPMELPGLSQSSQKGRLRCHDQGLCLTEFFRIQLESIKLLKLAQFPLSAVEECTQAMLVLL